MPFLQEADVLVFPSAPDGEGMPGVLIEAGLCGLPVVATRVAGASTVVDDGRTGLLVRVDDADALGRAVSGLVRDPALRHSMGQAAHDRCTAKFALPVVADRWDALLTLMASARDMRLPAVRRTRTDAGRLMCGIAGLLDTRRHAGPDGLHRLADAMASTLVHRGPDDAGTWVDAESGLGLAHRRLEVVGRGSQGDQPMLSPSTRWVITLQRRALQHTGVTGKSSRRAGLTIRGTSDTEVLVAGLDHWGLERHPRPHRGHVRLRRLGPARTPAAPGA